MRNFLIIFMCIIMSIISHAQLTQTQKQELAFYNVLKNQGFENGLSNWTFSGGTKSLTTSGSSLLAGTGTASWTPTAAQTLTQSVTTIPVGLYGRNGMAKIKYLGGDSTNYTFYIDDGSGNKLSDTATLTTASTAQTATVTFIWPSSGTVRMVLNAAASATQIHLDEIYLGENYLLTNITQAQLYGSATYPTTTNCNWSASSGSYANYSADADCPTPTLVANASAPATKVPGITFSSLPPGRYVVTVNALFFAVFSTTSNTCAWRIHDGTNGAGFLLASRNASNPSTGYVGNNIIASFNYTTAQSNITFQIQQYRIAGDGTCEIDNTGSVEELSLVVTRFPLSSETAYTPDVASWFIDANITFTSHLALGTSQTAYVAPSTTTGTLAARSYSSPVGISCSSTNENSVGSTTCSAGSEEIGVVFTAPRAGKIQCTAEFSHYMRAALTSDDITEVFQLIRTPNNAQTLTEEGGSRIESTLSNSAATAQDVTHPLSVTGIFNLTAAGKTTIRLMHESSVTGTPTSNLIISDANASYGQRDVRIFCNYIDNTLPMPNIVNSISTQYSGQLKMESADINCDAGSAITSQRGSWVSSVGNISGGACTVTIAAGVFSSAPYCWGVGNGKQSIFDFAPGITSTSLSFRCLSDAGAACASYDAYLLCMGPK